MHIFKKKVFYKFFTTTIEIPTIEQTNDALRLLLLFQYHKVEKIGWHEALEKSGFSLEESISAKHKLDKFCNSLDSKNYKLGGILNL